MHIIQHEDCLPLCRFQGKLHRIIGKRGSTRYEPYGLHYDLKDIYTSHIERDIHEYRIKHCEIEPVEDSTIADAVSIGIACNGAAQRIHLVKQ